MPEENKNPEDDFPYDEIERTAMTGTAQNGQTPDASPAPRNSGRVGNLKGLLIEGDSQRGTWNPIQHMARGSTKAEEYLPLIRIDGRTIARHKRIIASYNLVNLGNMDIMHVMWWGYHASIGEDGKGRHEIVQMVIAQRVQDSMNRQNRFNRMQGRARNGQAGLAEPVGEAG